MSESPSHSYVKYSTIFYALCVCTVLSIIFDILDLKEKDVVGIKGFILLAFLVLAVACAKALFVMIYFMHLKFEGKWKYVLLSPTIILAMGLTIAMTPDIGIHYYTNESPQIDYLKQAQQASSEDSSAKNAENSHAK